MANKKNSGITRRQFLRDSCMAGGVMAFAPGLLRMPGLGKRGGPDVPLALLFSGEEVARLRRTVEQPVFQSYWRQLLEMDLADDRRFLEKEINLHDHLRHIDRADKILEREAFVYLITGQRKRGALAQLALQRLLEYPKWDYFLEAGVHTIGLQRAPATTIAVSLAYDWLGDLLSKAQRQEMLRQIGDKGCEPCYRSLYGMRYPDRVVGWSFDRDSYWEERDMRRWPEILDKTNLKAVPMGALAVGAATLQGVDPRAERWWEMVEHSYRTFVNRFAWDGSYDEGGSYWDYTALHMALTVEMLARKRGTDYYDWANFPGMMEFVLALQMPHHGNPDYLVNFGDNGPGFDSAIGFWTARRSRDGLAQYAAMHHARKHSPYSVIWFDERVQATAPPAREHFKHLALDWVIARTGYELDDLVVAMRSGGPANHEHADRNSVILKCYGEVLLADIKRPPYDHRDPAWLLRTSPAHNTVLVDGQGHQYHDGKEGTNASLASAKILRIGEREGYLFWASDATHAYQLVNEDIRSVTRSVLLVPQFPCLLVVDKLHKSRNASLFAATWHAENSDGRAEMIFDGSTFAIGRPHARFYGLCGGSVPVVVRTGTHPVPKNKGIFPFIEVAATEPALEVLLLTVGCPVRSDQSNPDITLGRDGHTWKVEVALGDKRLHLFVIDTATLPEFEVSRLVL